MGIENDEYMHVVDTEAENSESSNESKPTSKNIKLLDKAHVELENGSTIVCDVKISWTECIKFWFSSFIAILLLWFVIMTLSAWMFRSMYEGY